MVIFAGLTMTTLLSKTIVTAQDRKLEVSQIVYVLYDCAGFLYAFHVVMLATNQKK